MKFLAFQTLLKRQKTTVITLAERDGDSMLLNAGLGLAVWFLVMYLAALPKGSVLGGADIKLTAAAGAFLGPVPILVATLIGSITAFIMIKWLALCKGRPADKLIAFVPYLSVGILVCIILPFR